MKNKDNIGRTHPKSVFTATQEEYDKHNKEVAKNIRESIIVDLIVMGTIILALIKALS